MNIENDKNKVHIAKKKKKTACIDALFLFQWCLWKTIIYWISDKKHFFSDIYFCINITMEMFRQDVSSTFFGSTWSSVANRIADTSTERVCQSK